MWESWGMLQNSPFPFLLYKIDHRVGLQSDPELKQAVKTDFPVASFRFNASSKSRKMEFQKWEEREREKQENGLIRDGVETNKKDRIEQQEKEG